MRETLSYGFVSERVTGHLEGMAYGEDRIALHKVWLGTCEDAKKA
jgi:hypothetical protein